MAGRRGEGTRRLVRTPNSLSYQEVPRLLGGPAGTTEELLETIRGLEFESGALGLLASSVAVRLMRDPEALRGLLHASGADVGSCISTIVAFLHSYTSIEEEFLDEAAKGSVPAEEALGLLRECPETVGRFRGTYTQAGKDLTRAQREVYEKLVTDRLDELYSTDHYSGVDVLGESRDAALIVA